MREFRYPTAVPPLESPPIDQSTGDWSQEWRRYFESLQIQQGGQGGDAIWDGVEQQATTEGRLQAVEALIASLRSDARGQDVDTLRQEIRAELGRIRGEMISAAPELGSLAYRDKLMQQDAAKGFAGIVAIATDTSADWVKSAVATPSKAATDYETLTLETDDFKIRPGDRVEVSFSYKNQGVRDMYEHFSHSEKVEILTSADALVSTLVEDVYPAWSSANTGYVPSVWSGEINIRHSEVVTSEVPNPLSGAWPSNRTVKVRMTLAPSTGASGGGSDCIRGGTFNASDVKTYFKCVNRRIQVRVIPSSITNLIG